MPLDSRAKTKIFMQWYGANRAKLSPYTRKIVESSGENLGAYDEGLGDMWSKLKDKLINSASDAVKQVADKTSESIAKVAENAPQIARAAAEYKIVRENIKRLDDNRPLINVTEVGGFGDIRNMVMIAA